MWCSSPPPPIMGTMIALRISFVCLTVIFFLNRIGSVKGRVRFDEKFSDLDPIVRGRYVG